MKQMNIYLSTGFIYLHRVICQLDCVALDRPTMFRSYFIDPALVC